MVLATFAGNYGLLQNKLISNYLLMCYDINKTAEEKYLKRKYSERSQWPH